MCAHRPPEHLYRAHFYPYFPHCNTEIRSFFTNKSPDLEKQNSGVLSAHRNFPGLPKTFWRATGEICRRIQGTIKLHVSSIDMISCRTFLLNIPPVLGVGLGKPIDGFLMVGNLSVPKNESVQANPWEGTIVRSFITHQRLSPDQCSGRPISCVTVDVLSVFDLVLSLIEV